MIVICLDIKVSTVVGLNTLNMSELEVSDVEVLDKFSSFGCCQICCLRFVGETNNQTFKVAVENREEKTLSEVSPSSSRN